MENQTHTGAALLQPRLVRNLNVRIRLLADGRYIAEERRGWWIFATWEAIDWKTPNFLWSPGDVFYKDCIGDYEQILRGIAGRGHSLPNSQANQPQV